MLRIFRTGPYIVYFLPEENVPPEPVHVYIAEGNAVLNAAKIRITSCRRAFLCNNASHIPQKTLENVIRLIEANSDMILDRWYSQFGEIRYFC